MVAILGALFGAQSAPKLHPRAHINQCTDYLVDSGFRNNFIFLECREISFYGESDHVFDRQSRLRDIDTRYVMVGNIIYECLFMLKVRHVRCLRRYHRVAQFQ